MRINFQSYPAVAEATFDCPKCGKLKRKRTFRAECTVNPFNVNDDGSVKTPGQVRLQSSAEAGRERDQFMREPLCATCENALSYSDRRALSKRRRQVEEPRP